MLFDVSFQQTNIYKKKKKEYWKKNLTYKIPEMPLNERPGLQRIAYSAIYDFLGEQNLIK